MALGRYKQLKTIMDLMDKKLRETTNLCWAPG